MSAEHGDPGLEERARIALEFLRRRQKLVRRFLVMLAAGFVLGLGAVALLVAKMLSEASVDSIHAAVEAAAVLLTGSIVVKAWSDGIPLPPSSAPVGVPTQRSPSVTTAP